MWECVATLQILPNYVFVALECFNNKVYIQKHTMFATQHIGVNRNSEQAETRIKKFCLLCVLFDFRVDSCHMKCS